MSQNPITPEKITKPIQLLGAWLAGLFAVNSCFLFAASRMESGSFESIALIIAAILNVPLFLAAVFLLQTRFRPELQEDSYYSTYLSQKTNEPIPIDKDRPHFVDMLKRVEHIEAKYLELPSFIEDRQEDIRSLIFGVNFHLHDKEQIKSALADKGVFKCTAFGGDSIPVNRVVSVSEYLPEETLKAVLQLAGHLGFKQYKTYNNQVEETLEDVLFGSYGDPEYEILTGSRA